MPLVLVSLGLGFPFLVLQGLATIPRLVSGALLFVLCHVIATPARPLLFQQWAAPGQYAVLNAVSLSLHSVLLATVISTSAWLITAVGELASGLRDAQCLSAGPNADLVGGGEGGRAPVRGSSRRLRRNRTPLRALRTYPAGLAGGGYHVALSATVDGHRHLSAHAPAGAARHASRAERATLGLFVLRPDSVRALGGMLEQRVSAVRSSSGSRRSVIRSLASC